MLFCSVGNFTKDYHFKNGVTKGNGSPFNASVAVGFRAEAFIGITGISASL